MILLVLGAVFGMGGFSYYLDTCCSFSPNHPLDLWGICSAPASLQQAGGIYAGIGAHVGCFTTTVNTVIVNGQSQQVVQNVPAGTFEYLNGSAASP